MTQYPCHCSQQANMQCVACNREGEITEQLRGDMNRLTEYTCGGEWTAAKMLCATMRNRFRILERDRENAAHESLVEIARNLEGK